MTVLVLSPFPTQLMTCDFGVKVNKNQALSFSNHLQDSWPTG